MLRRFVNLYGRPKEKNFVGAERELREAVDALHESAVAIEAVKMEGINWHFQPALTAHFGGAHEALVRLAKKAL